jgi:hypothetical protein
MSEEETFSRRKALSRIGAFATAAYTIPAMTTLSIAHASDASKASKASKASEPSEASEPSDPSAPSEPSMASGASDVEAAANSDECAAAGGTWDDTAGACSLT